MVLTLGVELGRASRALGLEFYESLTAHPI